ncbi:hypothetical protein [Microbacterium sp. GXS0129]|uniref:hypothetical protein n=1 Tax=Microbacterium sp. GXS0129 TaxID=3377836 RepID=UPI00383B97CB
MSSPATTDGRWVGTAVRFGSSWTTGRAFTMRVVLSVIVIALFFWAIAVWRLSDDDSAGILGLAALGLVVIALPYWIPLVMHRGDTEVSFVDGRVRVRVGERELLDMALSEIREVRFARTGAASRLTVRPARGTRVVCSIGEIYRTHREGNVPIERIAPVPAQVIAQLESAGLSVRSWRKRDAHVTLASR